MILLFGEKAKANSSGRSSRTKNNPVENSGILAKNSGAKNSVLVASEYDVYMFSQQADINYEAYSQIAYSNDNGFMSSFANAYSTLGDSGYSFDSSSSVGSECSSSASCCSFSSGGSFSSVC